MIYALIGQLAGLLLLVGDLPYFINAVKGITKPQRVTWGVLFLLNITSVANQLASGADDSIWFFVAASIAAGAIFLASLWKGVGGHTKQDIVAIGLSVAGLGLWAIFKDPLISILITAVVLAIAFYPTFNKARKDPGSETRISWLLATLGTILTAVAVGELDYQLLILPVWATMLQSYIVYLLYIRPSRSYR